MSCGIRLETDLHVTFASILLFKGCEYFSHIYPMIEDALPQITLLVETSPNVRQGKMPGVRSGVEFLPTDGCRHHCPRPGAGIFIRTEQVAISFAQKTIGSSVEELRAIPQIRLNYRCDIAVIGDDPCLGILFIGSEDFGQVSQF